MSEPKDSCVQAARGPIIKAEEQTDNQVEKEIRMDIARVGHPAPDFEAAAFVEGGFKNIKLSDYFGKWVILCFYPGDFTFV